MERCVSEVQGLAGSENDAVCLARMSARAFKQTLPDLWPQTTKNLKFHLGRFGNFQELEGHSNTAKGTKNVTPREFALRITRNAWTKIGDQWAIVWTFGISRL